MTKAVDLILKKKEQQLQRQDLKTEVKRKKNVRMLIGRQKKK